MKNILTAPTFKVGLFERSEPSALTVRVTLAGLIALCIGLSVFFFGQESLRLDEAQSLWQSGRTPFGILTLVAQDVHVPLYHELLHFWRLFFGDTVRSARAMSLFFFLLSIPAIYELGRETHSRRIGLMAAALLALSPFTNWYGNEIRMYSLFLLFAILNQYFFIRLFRGADRYAWLGYTATAILGVYSHYFFFLVFPGQFLFYIWKRKAFPQGSLKRFLISGALVGAAFAPWIAWVLYQGQAANQEPLLFAPTSVDLFNTFAQFIFGFQTDAINTVILSLWPISLLFAFFTLRRQSAVRVETEYFVLFIVVSFLLAFGVSIAVEPLFVSRYLIFTTPVLFLLLAALLDQYTPHLVRWGVLYVVAIMLALEIASPLTPVKEDYRSAVEYLSGNVRPQDVVVVSAPFTLYPFEYYYRGVAPFETIPKWEQYAHGAIPSYNPDTLASDLDGIAASHQELWLLLSYDQGYEEDIRSYMDSHYERILTREFSHDLGLYAYKIRYDTPLSKAPVPAAATTTPQS